MQPADGPRAQPAMRPWGSFLHRDASSGSGLGAPLLPGRIFDARRRSKVTLERFFEGGRYYRSFSAYYLSDMFHTLVNCPWYRFYLLFVFFYIAMYATFAAYYISFPGCITKVSNYWHALWFSVESSATIGYGHQAPDPECYALQLGVLVSLLMQASLLGLVFARISNSSGRSATIRFSKALSMYRGEDGVWRLAFRLANMRQHQVLQPEVRMLLLRKQASHPFSSPLWEFLYSELPAQHVGGGRLWLGVPSIIEHRVEEGSPLFGLGDNEMRAMDLEIIALLYGIDESTSHAIEARHSYLPSDIRWAHHFNPCIQRRSSGKLGVDFSLFDATSNEGRPRGRHSDSPAAGADGGSGAADAGAFPAASRRLPLASDGTQGALGEWASPFETPPLSSPDPLPPV